MDRRAFVAATAAGIAGATASEGVRPLPPPPQTSPRAQFPRLQSEVFLNAAGGTPLGNFASTGIQRYLDFIRYGPAEGRGAWVGEMWNGVRGRFATLVGAAPDEIGLVECTKAGEQIAIDGLDALRRGGNIVTNDLHFSGSLHNYEGLRRAGMDVRVVRADAGFDVTLERMADALDDRTALVSVSLVSNVNGRHEPVAELARLAHARGAIVFADIIQAVGAVPVDLHALDVDVAAASAYKWLFGVHGAGFLYVRQALQGSALRDRLFPGHVRRQYPPWVDAPAGATEPYRYAPPTGAVRYQPGHVSYLGYAAAYEAMGFLERVGGAAAVQRHATQLIAHLLGQIDTDRYRVITPDPATSTILALQPPTMDGLIDRLMAANVVISAGGDMERLLRISPAIYNTQADMDRLAEVLTG